MMVEYKGRERELVDLLISLDRYDKSSLIRERLKLGWSVLRAIYQPIRKYKKYKNNRLLKFEKIKNNQKWSLRVIFKVCCEVNGLTEEEVRNGGRQGRTMPAKRMYYYICKEWYSDTFKYHALRKSGAYIGIIDHATVINGHNRIEGFMTYDDDVRNKINKIEKILNLK